MKGLVIKRRSLWAQLDAWLRSSLPGLSSALAGPSTRYVIGEGASAATSPFRPLEIVLPDELLLKRRLRIPRQGLPDLAHAIKLLVSRETPFDMDELLICAQEEKSAESDERLSFALHMTPVASLRQALQDARLPIRSVRSVSIAEAGGSAIDVATALRPSLRLTRLLPLIPIVMIAGAAVSFSQALLAERNAQVTALKQQLEAQTTQLEIVSRRLEEEKARTASSDAVTRLVEADARLHDGLRWLRASLPETTEVLRFGFSPEALRLSVRSPDILADMETLQEQAGPCVASLDGAITADPSAGLELASILCVPREVR